MRTLRCYRSAGLFAPTSRSGTGLGIAPRLVLETSGAADKLTVVASGLAPLPIEL
ncbi:hypothetical protein [Lentzea cavernae]|uniref:hypothetical protein n=1 Tax=Lentzea cavernae TaxID=2020703 RepID=UPI00174DFB0F|nr:hypothetical protein [Lentzea cavernae]